MKRTEPLPLGELITEFLQRRQLSVGTMEGRAKDVWRSLAGDYVSGFTDEVFLREGILYVKVSSSAARNEIHIRRRYYLELLNSVLGPGSVRSIVIR